MNGFLRIGLPVYFFVFFVIAVAARSIVVWKKTGINPFPLKETDDVYGFIRFALIPAFLLILLSISCFSFFPQAYQYIAPISWLENYWIKVTGLLFLITALVWIIIAQIQMGESWRVGIDKENKTELIQKGLFTVSRNPIFFGMRMMFAGFFLTMPNAITLMTFGVGDVLIQMQVRIEEEHLTRLHGEKYDEYRKQVRRWV